MAGDLVALRAEDLKPDGAFVHFVQYLYCGIALMPYWAKKPFPILAATLALRLFGPVNPKELVSLVSLVYVS